MNTRILATSLIALALLAPAAIAGNNFGNPNAPAGSEVTNQQIDYLVDGVASVDSQGFAAAPTVGDAKGFNTGDYIDESNVERNQRSSQ